MLNYIRFITNILTFLLDRVYLGFFRSPKSHNRHHQHPTSLYKVRALLMLNCRTGCSRSNVTASPSMLSEGHTITESQGWDKWVAENWILEPLGAKKISQHTRSTDNYQCKCDVFITYVGLAGTIKRQSNMIPHVCSDLTCFAKFHLLMSINYPVKHVVPQDAVT